LAEAAVSTYNSFAAHVVRDHALRIGRDPDSALITQAGEWQLMSEVVDGWQGPLETHYAPSTVKKGALRLAEGLRSHLVDVEEARRFTREALVEVELLADAEGFKVGERASARDAAKKLRLRLELLRVIEVYLAHMRERGFVTFSDQVGIACQVAERVAEVGEAFRSQYRSVLLDEFQDTSVAQLALLHDLFGSGYPAMAVGDPNQAIYGWRGASASSLTSFAEMFAPPGGETRVLSLTTSWRNDAAILEAANTVSEDLKNQEGAGELLSDLTVSPIAEEGTIHRTVTLTEPEEADAVARWISERWIPGKTSAAVLCRAGNQFASVIRSLRARGIEPEVVGLKGLLGTPEVVDLRAALEVVADASRGDAMMRLLTNERLGLADLQVLSEWATALAGEDARGETDVSAAIVEAVDALPPESFQTRGGNRLTAAGRLRVERLRSQLREIRGALSYPLTDLVAAAERALLLDIEVTARPGAVPSMARGNLDQFRIHASNYTAGSATPTLGGFLEWLDSADEAESGLEAVPTVVSVNSVQVLTVHAAKGLEWDVVAVPGLTETNFPSIRSHFGRTATKEKGWLTEADQLPAPLRGDAQYLPEFDRSASTPVEFSANLAAYETALFERTQLEERRLAYVAITRARRQLLLAGSHYRSGKNPHTISPFLTELEGHSEVPEGFEYVPTPDPADGPREEPEEVPPTYPATDPLVAEGSGASRRAQLERAAGWVRDARAEIRERSGEERSRGSEGTGGMRGSGGPQGLDLTRVESLLANLSSRATETGDAALVDDARVLIRELMGRGGPEAVELPQHLSASAAMALTRSPDQFALDLRRPIPRQPSREARLGTEFHAWVEHHFNMPSLMGSSDWGEDEDAAGTPEGFSALRDAFLSSPWAVRTPVAVEQDLETTIAGQLIRCRIDAVFVIDGHTVVVDWKTGREPRSAEERDHRRFQLEIYRLAYARANHIPLDQVRAAFHYVASGVTQDSGMWTAAQVEARVLDALEHRGSLETLGVTATDGAVELD
ncbi:MAG TPA: ATP-dependent helicase, partial [Actinomycetales bacterium]|nr:ATP-dependent helicase [Actinomycetales bacterium]